MLHCRMKGCDRRQPVARDEATIAPSELSDAFMRARSVVSPAKLGAVEGAGVAHKA
jgi:hypothetical protein